MPQSEPTIHGMTLSIGDDLGLNATPDCCDDEMDGKATESGGREYTCGDCGTELIVRANGLVFDIHAPA